jgi:hypothetical protein
MPVFPVVSIIWVMLLVHIVSMILIAAVLLVRLAIALIVGAIVAIVLLLRRVPTVLLLHRSLLVLVVVSLTMSFVGSWLIIRHAAGAMAVRVVCLGVE